ncbi:hypothetical protein MTO96_041749, partial [Rhipicephalus appendiculatus]
MGLPSSVFWIGHFLSAWLVSSVEAAFAIYVTIIATEPYQPDPTSNSPEKTLKPNELEEFNRIYNRVYQNVPTSTRYLQNADGTLVVALFATFVTCHTLLALFIACAFPLGRWAMTIAFGLYFIFPMCDGEKMSFFLEPSLIQYLSDTRVEKLRIALYPNVAFNRIMKIIGIFDDFESRWAMTIAFGLYFIFPMCDGEKMSFFLEPSLIQYLSDTRVEKLRIALYPNVAFNRIMKIIGIFDDFE